MNAEKFICNCVTEIKKQFGIPNFDNLLRLATHHNIKVVTLNWVAGPMSTYSDLDPGHIILPEVLLETNLAHELGHTILRTTNEYYANYFAAKLIGTHHYISVAQNIGPIIQYAKYLRERFADSEKVERDITDLEKRRFPDGLIDRIYFHTALVLEEKWNKSYLA